jgi:hypothetical protein
VHPETAGSHAVYVSTLEAIAAIINDSKPPFTG